MFLKTSWSTYKGKRSVQHHVAESYRDAKTGKPRHRLLANVTGLPGYVIESIRKALRSGRELIDAAEIKVETGDSVRGAGILAAYRVWQQEGMREVLVGLSEAEKASALAMVVQRMLTPGSKLSLKEQLADTLLAKVLSAKRLDEDELYRVMDILEERFYCIQERIRRRRDAAPLLCLYDLTSTYFEGSKAQGGAYGHGSDKRWDRYRIVIGLVCDEVGVPLAVEVFPGNTAHKSTVSERLKSLQERFNIDSAVFVGDAGLYSQVNIDTIVRLGFDYILRPEWHTQRKQLESLTPTQLGLFDERGIVEWQEDDARYVGCLSLYRRERSRRRREKGMEKTRLALAGLAETATKGAYYSFSRLREKVSATLKDNGVKDLWHVEITPLGEEDTSPEQKQRLKLEFSPNIEAIERRSATEGIYVLRTSLCAETCSAEEVDKHYRRLRYAERAFRHIKSYLKLRPVHHYLWRRIKAHVLICFLAYYLIKKLELTLRAKGETREVERVLHAWDKLTIVEQTVTAGEHQVTDWQWSLGEVGENVQNELKNLSWWPSLDSYRRSLTRRIAA